MVTDIILKHKFRWLGLGALWIAVLSILVYRTQEKPVELPPPSQNIQLPLNDLAFGRQQVDQMMRDREEMAKCVEKGDIIYEWAARQFAGEAVGKRIYWDPNPPNCPPDCLSSINTPYQSYEGTIALKELHTAKPQIGEAISCEELRACAVFELYNISNSASFNKDHEDILAGKISKDEYIINTTKIEYRAVQKTTLFYHAVWEPYSRNKQMVSDGYYWFANEPTSYEEWIKQYSDPNGYPHAYYGEEYDKRILPNIMR